MRLLRQTVGTGGVAPCLLCANKKAAPSMLQHFTYEDLGLFPVAPEVLQELCTRCLPTRGLARLYNFSCIDFWGLTEASKLFGRSFLFPSPAGRGMNDVFPSATLMFILSKRGNLGLSLNGRPGCGEMESGSRNIIVFLIREVIPAAYTQASSTTRGPDHTPFKGH